MNQPPSFQPDASRRRPRPAAARPPQRPAQMPPVRRPVTPRPKPAANPPAYAPHRPNPDPQSIRARIQAPQPKPAPAPVKKPVNRRRRLVLTGAVMGLVLLLLLAWPIGLIAWANSKLVHVDALSSAPSQSGTTYLIAGSDARSDGSDGGIAGGPNDSQRADSIVLIHWAANGQKSMVSIPRDTAVEIPELGLAKINASFGVGGPKSLVAAVEKLSGMKVDHYVQVSMGGVTHMVDAVGGINVCYPEDVDDPLSEMVWKAGCHDVNGKQALAFARMRYADPRGDIGRTERQRQVIGRVVSKGTQFPGALSPWRQVSLVDGVTKTLIVSNETGITDIGWLALALRGASKEGLNGVPPIASMAYYEGGYGAKVLITPEAASTFFGKMRAGTLTKADYQGEN